LSVEEEEQQHYRAVFFVFGGQLACDCDETLAGFMLFNSHQMFSVSIANLTGFLEFMPAFMHMGVQKTSYIS